MAGTGFLSASAGSQMRAASRGPLFSGTKKFLISRTPAAACNESFAMFLPRCLRRAPARRKSKPSYLVARNPMLEAAAEEPLAIGKGVHLGMKDEIPAIRPHADAGFQPRIPIIALVVRKDRYDRLGGQRIVGGNGEFLHFAIAA